MKRYLILFCLFAISTGGVFFYYKTSVKALDSDIALITQNRLDSENVLNAIGKVEMLASNPLPELTDDSIDSNSSPIDLTTEEYIQILEELDNLVYTQDPRAAFGKLRELYAGSKAIRNSCHGLAHYLGHGGFKKYNNMSDAINSGDDFCGNGYLHGVIEEYFGSLPDLEGIFLDVCGPSDHSCIHGVGHGFMYFFDNDLPKSLEFCDKYPYQYQKTYCSEGLFHENFETNSDAHIPKFLNPSDPTFPCYNYSGAFREVCMYYSGRYIVRANNNDYKAAIKICEQSVSPSSCVSGVGSITMRQNFDNTIEVQNTCESAAGYLQRFCMSGAIGYHQVNSRSTIAFKDEVCAVFTNQSLRNVCYSF